MLIQSLGTRAEWLSSWGWQERNLELLTEWAERLFKAELLALEHDRLHGKVVTDRIKVSDAAVRAVRDDASTSNKAQPDIKLLRGVQVNAVLSAV